MASVNPANVSRMGKSDHNLYRSLESARAVDLDYMVDVIEVSDISTSRD